MCWSEKRQGSEKPKSASRKSLALKSSTVPPTSLGYSASAFAEGSGGTSRHARAMRNVCRPAFKMARSPAFRRSFQNGRARIPPEGGTTYLLNLFLFRALENCGCRNDFAANDFVKFPNLGRSCVLIFYLFPRNGKNRIPQRSFKNKKTSPGWERGGALGFVR